MAAPKYTPLPSEEDKSTTLPTRPRAATNSKPRGIFPLDIPILNQLKGKRIILASASPRRKQILGSIGLTNIEIIPSTLPEDLSKRELGPFEYVLQTANRKCLSVYQTCLDNAPASIPDPSLVIAADTVIVTNSGNILEKPRSEADHIRMLKQLRNERTHRVFTAVAVLAPRDDARFPGYNAENEVVETKVVFDQDVGDDLIEAYVKTREGVDKAGGYAVQGMGALLIERIEGCFDNVVGLPIKATLALIETVVLKQDDMPLEEIGDGSGSEEEEEED